MISIIICSINKKFLIQIKENIASTIGVDYELLVWENKEEKKGLCEIYNLMAARAQFKYLCFLHEDILFETKNWGNSIIKQFNADPDLGVIGVAGSRYKSSMYSGWFSGNPDYDYFNITHRTNGKDNKLLQPAIGIGKLHEVVCIDGVFIFCQNIIWQKIMFNETLLKGFHFYDIDFSLRASKITKVMVVLEIDIVHITLGGDFGDKWVEAAILFHNHFHDQLPYYCGQESSINMETAIAIQWLDLLKKEKISFGNKIRWIKNQKLYSLPNLFYNILKFLIYEPLHLSVIHKCIR